MKRFVRLQTIEVDKIKGSRFIVTVSPIATEEHFKDILSRFQQAHPNANHHCWAWRLSGGKERSSDDGEPSGSAGEPILQRLTSSHLIDSMIIVTRYFGGTKLGVGGLIRAYGGSAGEVINKADIETLTEKDVWTIVMNYSDQALVKSIIVSKGGEISLERYTDRVYLKVLVDPTMRNAFSKTCLDRTAGRVDPVFVQTEWTVESE